MDTPRNPLYHEETLPPPLTPERVRRAREYIAAIHADLRRRGIDLSRFPDPVEELSKARTASS